MNFRFIIQVVVLVVGCSSSSSSWPSFGPRAAGSFPSSCPTGHQRGRQIDWFSVDPSSDRCRRRIKNPPPDTHLSPFSGTFTTDLLSTAVAVGPTIVSLGGSGKGDQCSVVLPDVHAFDTHRPDRDWVACPPMNHPRLSPYASVIGGKLYVICGHCMSESDPRLEVRDQQTLTRGRLAPPPFFWSFDSDFTAFSDEYGKILLDLGVSDPEKRQGGVCEEVAGGVGGRRAYWYGEVVWEEAAGVIAPFDPSKKKKKKKVVIQDPAEESVEKLTEKTETLTVSDGLEATFSGLKKKKKKPVQTDLLEDEKEIAGDDLDDNFGEDEEGEGIVLQQQRLPWEGTDRDYEYEELLGRVFNILRENNPELAGDRRRTVMRPPQVLREGTKKTVFVNFMDLCKTMHRQLEHVMTFLLAELGTSGSLDGQQRLVVKGRFAPKNFEGILRRYVNEYVICNGCKSPDTILSKENRLFFLRCEKCGSGRSVAPIKAGFVARVGRRKAGT
ncbi:hypothetical protein RJ640_025241 [Escallonia rubra]|uniref:Eukaryotic translation initiation factor 2 subunit beta n=1 Tax=Escallonia rubra TaxID=112253 RepID=A0AA88QTI4_9ASTE|nr:hypothetical protein RJ640_025241 [Escallonia rubra]